MKISRIACSLAVTTLALGLAACGDDITEQINVNVGAVETSDDLPECTKDIAGQTAFVSETHEFLGCDGKEWQTLSANTVSVGDNVCTSTSLSDDSGFEIFCNGESIGKVKNGQKGDKGDAGTGCKIQESTELTATIACGSETFTMDFTGYVDVPAECDSTDADCAVPLDNVDLSGVSQKGPFVSGTDVTAYELENGRSLKQTGKTFGGKIENQDGSFNIRTVKLKSSYAYLVADGFYRNEVTGENSAATIKLRALTNLDGRSTANINLVTHLEYDRVQRLVTKDNKSVIEAKRAAEKSLFAAFNIDNTGFKGFAEDLNIFKEGDGNAALLAVSAMLQGDRNESELTALLAAFSVDLGDNGMWDDSLRRAQIADWAMKADLEGRLATIRANVEGWKLSESKAPAFEAPFRNFWQKELGVGECTTAGTLFATKNVYSAYYAAKDSVYTDGDSSLVRLICDADGETPVWRFATDFEKDIAALGAADDGAVRRGSVDNANVYVMEDGWRRGTDLDTAFKACISTNRGLTDSMIVLQDTVWYICAIDGRKLDDYTIPSSWRIAKDAEADTALFGIPETAADSVKRGRINKEHVFVYEDLEWRRGTELDLEDGLGACIQDRVDSIRHKTGAADTTDWYKCVTDEDVYADGKRIPSVWRKASTYEADLPYWNSLFKSAMHSYGDSVGLLMVGPYSGLTMVWDNATNRRGALRQATEFEIQLGMACVGQIYGNSFVLANGLSYDCTKKNGWSKVGRFTDTRDNISYRAVQLGNRVWMAENLRYQYPGGTRTLDSSSFCYDNVEENCSRYGRLYLWSAIVDSAGVAGNVASNCGYGTSCNLPKGSRGVCPEGWHLPTDMEWLNLESYAGGVNQAAELLKTTSGWAPNANGTDAYSFSVYPSGGWGRGSNFGSEPPEFVSPEPPEFVSFGKEAYFWSYEELSGGGYDYDKNGIAVHFYSANRMVHDRAISKADALSVRCVKDELVQDD